MSDRKSSESNFTFLSFLKKINQVIISNSKIFLEQPLKKFFFLLGILLLIFIGYFAYERFYLEAHQEKALNHLFYARQYFLRDEIKKALGGDPSLRNGGYMGFVDIIKNFPSTQAANIAYFYASLLNYKLGNYENSLKLLKYFSAKDNFLFPIKYGMMADTYVQLHKNNQAFNYYIKAIQSNDNNITTPIYLYKAAILSFNIGKYKEAQNCFFKLKEEYPKSAFVEEIDKYLSLINVKLQK